MSCAVAARGLPLSCRAPALGLLVLLAGAAASQPASATPTTGLVISEVLLDPIGANGQKQWVELFNGTGASIDLSTYSLGWGRRDYLRGVFQLGGTLAAGSTWVVGGPTSSNQNGNPVFDQAQDLAPNPRIGLAVNRADGIALFDVPAASIVDGLAPIHALIYGRSTATTVLIDETGGPGSILFTTDGLLAGQSIEFLGGNSWQAAALPTPGVAAIPEPAPALLVGLGLAVMARRAPRAGPSRR